MTVTCLYQLEVKGIEPGIGIPNWERVDGDLGWQEADCGAYRNLGNDGGRALSTSEPTMPSSPARPTEN